MKLESLRTRHPRFHYRSFEVERLRSATPSKDPHSSPGETLRVRFDFLLEPDIVFRPEVSFPVADSVTTAELEELIFQLGLVEMISYWKCTCSPEIVVSAAAMNPKSIEWWKDLFLHGLGEFYWQNKIDFSDPNFFSITSAETHEENKRFTLKTAERDLILVGGGKDSSLTLELFSSNSTQSRVMALNPTRSSLDSARIAGYSGPVVIRRRIDPRLLELNTEGYLNGHTPFSAYLAFLGTLVAAANGFSRVIASNETSADEANHYVSEMPINHQYSKSFRFERLFRDYAKTFLANNVEYYSILRPLHDIQISMLFSQYERQLRSFRSCNVHQRQDSWCGKCPKCAFVFLTLAPFLKKEKMLEIFGANYFLDEDIQNHIRDLIGAGDGKPFECVGTMEESLLALQLTVANKSKTLLNVPTSLSELVEAVCAEPDLSLLHAWSQEHFLPLHQEALLKNALKEGLNALDGD